MASAWVFDSSEGNIRFTDENLAILKVDSSAHLKAETTRFRDENHKGYLIRVELDDNVPLGAFTDLITLHTNLKKRPRLDVPVLANVIQK